MRFTAKQSTRISVDGQEVEKLSSLRIVKAEIEGTMEMNGQTCEVYYYTELKAEGEFSNYGTTVITLPSQIKDEVEALLQDKE